LSAQVSLYLSPHRVAKTACTPTSRQPLLWTEVRNEEYPNIQIAFGMGNADFTVRCPATTVFRDLMKFLVFFVHYFPITTTTDIDIWTRFSRKTDSIPRHSAMHLCFEERVDGGGFEGAPNEAVIFGGIKLVGVLSRVRNVKTEDCRNGYSLVSPIR
jgi:hypothetical protein